MRILHRGRAVATHAELTGRYQLAVLPEHGPGAVARNARLRSSTPLGPPRTLARDAIDVQQRDLTTYDALAAGGER